VTDTLLISELAARSGVPSTTLRYYEQVGLMPAAARSSGGYRVYDERAVSRLRFISRTKALGLALEDIRELVAVWDDDRCGPVQDRLRELLADRQRDVAVRIEQLRLLAGELADAADALTTDTPGARCGDHCGCAGTDAEPAGMLVDGRALLEITPSRRTVGRTS
jgi:DNA-binding transcriptional MerR regulator